MRRKFLSLLALLLYASSVFSQDSSSEYNFVVWLHDGGKVSFPLDAHPVVTHSDGTLVVSSVSNRMEYAHSSVCKFTLSAEDISQGDTTEIATIEFNARWHRQGDVMQFSDCTPGESVSLYDASGRLLQQHVIGSDGTLQIPLSPFAGGMYVVKTESITYKFMKR